MSIVNYWDRNWKSWWQINVCIIQMVLCIWNYRTETKRNIYGRVSWHVEMERERLTQREKYCLHRLTSFSIIFFLCMQNWLKQYHWWFFSSSAQLLRTEKWIQWKRRQRVCLCRQSECATQDSANGKWFSFYHLRVGLFSQDMTFYAVVNFSCAILPQLKRGVRGRVRRNWNTHSIANRR